jgi:hypothetical protein
MGWSLNRLSPRDPELIETALLTAGKALYLANAFESKCRYVLKIANLEAHISTNPDASLVDAVASLAKDKLLGPTINDLKKFPSVSEPQVTALEKARDARNYIAHEGAYFGSLQARPESIHKHLARLRAAVKDLVPGDDVVSRWVYEIEEKELASCHIMTDYPEMVESWVFGELHT